MDEVDGIIIHSLRTVGSQLDENIGSLREFTTELIYSSAVLCVEACLGEQKDLPKNLPGGMSQRFRVGTLLANLVSELGYSGDLGYQTFLYSNETDIRKVFMFLVEKLPRESTGQAQEMEGSGAKLEREVRQCLGVRQGAMWAPGHCLKNGLSWRGTPAQWCLEGVNGCSKFQTSNLLLPPPEVADLTAAISKESRGYYDNHLPYVHEQINSRHKLITSILELNASQSAIQQEAESDYALHGLRTKMSREEYRAKKRERIQQKVKEGLKAGSSDVKSSAQNTMATKVNYTERENEPSEKVPALSSRFALAEKLQFTEDSAPEAKAPEKPSEDKDNVQDLKTQREDEIKEWTEALAKVSRKLNRVESDLVRFTDGTTQMEDQVKTELVAKEKKESDYTVKKKTIDLLPDSKSNITKLAAMVEASNQKLANLAAQWEQHQRPLLDHIEALKGSNSKSEEEITQKLEEIKQFRQRMKGSSDEARTKEEQQRQLQAELEGMSKDVNRASYTKRILEIVSKIKRQKGDIEKVLSDTKSLQKEINQLTGKLDRSFTVTDELIFRDAKKDAGVKKAYKFLASLHENCDYLIKTVEDTGAIMREIRDLEDLIEQEDSQKVLDNLEKLMTDFKMVKAENAEMSTRLKKLTAR